jgi:hypothetical protein
MTVQEIIDLHPHPSDLDRDLLLRCIEECLDCAASCTACADACLGESDVAELRRCIRLNLDCADACDATGRIVTRQTSPDLRLIRAIVEACAVACLACPRSAIATRRTTNTVASAPPSVAAASRRATSWS